MNGAPRISRAAREVKESRIRRLTIEAMKYQAVNLAQAFPDYQPPKAFIQALISAAETSLHQYTDTWGSLAARRLVSEYVTRFHPGVQIDPDTQVLITIGAMEAMNDALFVALDPGDEVILLEPFYECFVAQILSRHGVPKYVPLDDDGEGGFTLNLHRVEEAFTSRSRAVILNTPGNPSGKIFRREEIEGLLDICRRRNAWLISDETYEHIYYGDHRPVSVVDVDPGFTHSVMLTGFGKTFSVTGWRAGFLVSNPEFLRHVRPPHDVNTICAVPFIQEALPALVSVPDEYFEDLRTEYRQRRTLLSEGLQACGFGINKVEGAYYVLARIPKWWRGSGSELNAALLEGGFVAGVPGEVFHGPNRGGEFIRYTFCKKRSSLTTAMQRLEAGMQFLRKS